MAADVSLKQASSPNASCLLASHVNVGGMVKLEGVRYISWLSVPNSLYICRAEHVKQPKHLCPPGYPAEYVGELLVSSNEQWTRQAICSPYSESHMYMSRKVLRANIA